MSAVLESMRQSLDTLMAEIDAERAAIAAATAAQHQAELERMARECAIAMEQLVTENRALVEAQTAAALAQGKQLERDRTILLIQYVKAQFREDGHNAQALAILRRHIDGDLVTAGVDANG